MSDATTITNANAELQAEIKGPFNQAVAALANVLNNYTFVSIGAEGSTYNPTGTYTALAATETVVRDKLAALVNEATGYATIGTLPSYAGLAQNTATTDYKSALFSDSNLTTLKAKLALVINNIAGDDDVDSLVTKLSTATGSLQVATFQTDLQRKQQVLADLYAMADSTVGNKGFTYPNSMTVGLKLDAQQKYQFDLTMVSRDIMKMVYEWAKQEYRFAIENTEKNVQSDMDFNMKYAEACARTYQLALQGVLETYKEQLAGIVAKFDAEARRYGLCMAAAKSAAEINQMKDSEWAKRYGPHIEYLVNAYKASIESAQLMVNKNIAAADSILKSTIAFSSANSNVGVAIVNG